MVNVSKNDSTSAAQFIECLLDPAVYPHECEAPIRLKETHSAWVVLTGKFAYKIKKPVDFGFLDFSSLSKRQHFCQREIDLNRKFAAEIYLDVVAIRRHKDRIHINGSNGSVLEYAVKMHQFSDNTLLTDLIREQVLSASQIDQLAKTIAAIHMQAQVAPVQSPYGSPELVGHWMDESFTHIGKVTMPKDEVVELRALKAWCISQHQILTDTLLKRKREGKIRDCHGDLHLGNLVLVNNKILPFDRIEFNDELRWIDSINEIAFLIMDLAEHGAPAWANRLINRYLQITGDYAGLKVLPYYLVYRALVRAKVAALRREQLAPTSEGFKQQSIECQRYIAYAKHASTARRGCLIITYGVSGSGKSFLAERVCEQLGAIQIRSDLERKRLFERDRGRNQQTEVNAGSYLPEKIDAVYAHILKLANVAMTACQTVVLDATFLQKKHRDQARELAQEKSLPFVILHCVSPNEVLLQRIKQRTKDGADPSEATEAVLRHQLTSTEQLGDDEKAFAVVMDTSGEAAVEKALHFITQALVGDEMCSG